MQSDAKVINTLNSLLAHELNVASQYMVHAEMCENWDYDKLAEIIQKRAVNEMKHAGKLIERILFLEGIPVVSEPRKILVGSEVPKMFANDLIAEDEAIKFYNAGIVLCGELKDYATRDMLQNILNDEDNHTYEIEEVQRQISQMGLQVFLSTKTK
jgi:bacterioferritin